ncbi:MAG: PBP1A family penicillin-binding protein [Alphaproteobacteria bacterium]|nr:MAG: PBP1A family penicillin-binding protein [Alphaproteobacteria bacterium]
MRLSRSLGFVFTALIFLGVLGFIILGGVFYFFGSGLQDYKQLKDYEPPVTTRFYANDGRMFAEYAHEKRLFVPLKGIPLRVRQAFMAAEDKSFYTHGGLNFVSIIRAGFKNFLSRNSGKRPIGASTITQQVARNFLLNSISREISLSRKIKEAILTFRIESAYTKDHIFELYLNEISLGNNSFGVASAALNYFNKSLEDLTVAEMALLAALPKGPSYYNPRRRKKRALDRRNWVISQMLKAKYITHEEALQATHEPLKLRDRNTSNLVSAGYFADEVRREMITLFGETALYKGGLAIRTTLNPEWQKTADSVLQEGLIAYDRQKGWRGPLANVSQHHAAIKDAGWLGVFSTKGFPRRKGVPASWKVGLVLEVSQDKAIVGFDDGSVGKIPLAHVKWARKYITVNSQGPPVTHISQVLKKSDVVYVKPHEGKRKNHKGTFELCQVPKVSGGLVVLDPHTGRVFAISGGFSFENSQFNRVTQAKRQPGSALKPFIYLKALENGLLPTTIVDDSPLAIDLGPDQGVYTPHNYTGKFYGPVTLRWALEKSLNIPPVRLVYESVTLGGFAEITERFGIYERMPLHYSTTLGAEVVTLLKLTTAYAMLVNGGYRIQPTLIIRAQDRRGFNVLNDMQHTVDSDITAIDWAHQEPPILGDKRTLITNPINAYQILSILEGSVMRGTSRNAKVPGLTMGGKTGTSNDFHDAWFVGFTPDVVVGVYVGYDGPTSLGNHQSGARVAAPIVKEFMMRTKNELHAVPFRIPKGAQFVRVDYRTGKRTQQKGPDVISEVFDPKTPLCDDEEVIPEEAIESESPDHTSFGTGGLY